MVYSSTGRRFLQRYHGFVRGRAPLKMTTTRPTQPVQRTGASRFAERRSPWIPTAVFSERSLANSKCCSSLQWRRSGALIHGGCPASRIQPGSHPGDPSWDSQRFPCQSQSWSPPPAAAFVDHSMTGGRTNCRRFISSNRAQRSAKRGCPGASRSRSHRSTRTRPCRWSKASAMACSTVSRRGGAN
jgi:hypothetical protein